MNSQASVEPSGSNDESLSTPADRVRVAIAAGIALITLIFTAVGVAGDLLVRLVRNHPVLTSIVFILVLLGLALAALGRGKMLLKTRIALSTVLTVAAAGLAVWLSTQSLSDREVPTVAMTPTWSTGRAGAATVSVKAAAVSLRSQESLLLRVIGVSEDAVKWGHSGCSVAAAPWETQKLERGATILYWGESGPSLSGAAESSITLPVRNTEFRYLCAQALLYNRPHATTRAVLVFLDMKRASTGSAETASPSPKKAIKKK